MFLVSFVSRGVPEMARDPRPGLTTATPETHSALLTADKVAELLAVPASWVYAEARAGRIPHVTLGRYRRFRREAIEGWIADRERGPR